MLLDQPTKSLEVSLSSLPTIPLSLVCEYTAGLPVGTAPQARLQILASLAAAGITTALAAPASGQQYEITHLSLYNANPVALIATVQIRVTPAGGLPTTAFVKYQATLQPGDNLFYQSNNHGFFVIDSTGSARGIYPLPLGAARDVTVSAVVTGVLAVLAGVGTPTDGSVYEDAGGTVVSQLRGINTIEFQLMEQGNKQLRLLQLIAQILIDQGHAAGVATTVDRSLLV